MSNIATRLCQVEQQIDQLCQRYGRDRHSVQLLAVSKRQPAAAVLEAIAAGQMSFGENYLQEALEKQQSVLAAEPQHMTAIEWQMIGPLQSNKTAQAAAHMDWVQSIDRLKIASRLSAQRPDTLPNLNVCVQVNISGEASKAGVAPEQLDELLPQIAALPKLTLRGLMAIPAAATELSAQRHSCAAMYRLFQQYAAEYHLDTLSMGMSADMEAAVAEGSTQLRVGTAIFGARQPA